MDLTQYESVIKMALEDNAGRSPDEVMAAIAKNIAIADRILGNSVRTQAPAAQRAANIVQMPAAQAPAVQRAAIIQSASSVSASAGIEPPVVGGFHDENEVRDYWESKPGKDDGPERLREALARELPGSIDITVPGVDEPITLRRGLDAKGSPMPFVRVVYTIPGDEVGPQVMVMTTDKTFDPEKIEYDIREQAKANYGVNRKAVQVSVPIVQAPSMQEVMSRLVSGDAVHPMDRVEAAEDAAEFARTRGQVSGKVWA